jgi:hypothetical protein
MVVKPHDFISKGRGYADPAVICRGPEYLRILYGPEYLLPKNLELLRSRDLGANRSFASREFALGIESVEVFVRKEPLPDSRVRLRRSGIGERVRRSAPVKQESFRETSAKTEARNYSLSARR